MSDITEAIRIHSYGAMRDERHSVVVHLNRALQDVVGDGVHGAAAAYALRMAIQDIKAGKHVADMEFAPWEGDDR